MNGWMDWTGLDWVPRTERSEKGDEVEEEEQEEEGCVRSKD
jgi:hypothetical protein